MRPVTIAMPKNPLTQALALREKALGPDHPDVATSLNNLAGLYHAQGRYAKAEPLYQRALAIPRRPSAPTIPTWPRASTTWPCSIRPKAATPRPSRSMSARWRSGRRPSGPTIPEVGREPQQPGRAVPAQGQYAKAEPLYQRALAIREKALGPDHPDVAASLNNLAGLYRAQGQYAKAEPLYQRALAIGEKALGPDHPDVATASTTWRCCTAPKGEYAKAEPLYQRALRSGEGPRARPPRRGHEPQQPGARCTRPGQLRQGRAAL